MTIQEIKNKMAVLDISQAELVEGITSEKGYISKIINEKIHLSKTMQNRITKFLEEKEQEIRGIKIVNAEVVHYIHSYCPSCEHHNVGVIEHNSYCHPLLNEGKITCDNCGQKYIAKIDKEWKKDK